MNVFIRTIAIIGIVFSIVSAPAIADSDKHKWRGKREREWRDDDRRVERVFIQQPDRVVIQRYIGSDYYAHCPPGLAKKHNGCLPPGQAKKRYIIGRPLPRSVVYEPVPHDLLVQLRPVPMDYQYVMVDRDVLLISQASHEVIDAITLLSAVGR